MKKYPVKISAGQAHCSFCQSQTGYSKQGFFVTYNTRVTVFFCQSCFFSLYPDHNLTKARNLYFEFQNMYKADFEGRKKAGFVNRARNLFANLQSQDSLALMYLDNLAIKARLELQR